MEIYIKSHNFELVSTITKYAFSGVYDFLSRILVTKTVNKEINENMPSEIFGIYINGKNVWVDVVSENGYYIRINVVKINENGMLNVDIEFLGYEEDLNCDVLEYEDHRLLRLIEEEEFQEELRSGSESDARDAYEDYLHDFIHEHPIR